MKIFHAIGYSAWLAGQVVIAATDVIVDTLRIKQKQEPVLIGLPLRVRSDLEVTLFAESITMTPGTLVCGVRAIDGPGDCTRLFIIHAIFGNDLPALYDSLYDMEERLAPWVKDFDRPKPVVFEEYDRTLVVDPDAKVGTAAETAAGLDGVTLSGKNAASTSDTAQQFTQKEQEDKQ